MLGSAGLMLASVRVGIASEVSEVSVCRVRERWRFRRHSCRQCIAQTCVNIDIAAAPGCTGCNFRNMNSCMCPPKTTRKGVPSGQFKFPKCEMALAETQEHEEQT